MQLWLSEWSHGICIPLTPHYIRVIEYVSRISIFVFHRKLSIRSGSHTLTYCPFVHERINRRPTAARVHGRRDEVLLWELPREQREKELRQAKQELQPHFMDRWLWAWMVMQCRQRSGGQLKRCCQHPFQNPRLQRLLCWVLLPSWPHLHDT